MFRVGGKGAEKMNCHNVSKYRSTLHVWDFPMVMRYYFFIFLVCHKMHRTIFCLNFLERLFLIELPLLCQDPSLA